MIPHPVSAVDVYREEKRKRGLRIVPHVPLGPISDKKLERADLACPHCGGKVITMAYKHRPRKKATARQTSPVRCATCEHRWYTSSRQLWAGSRQVEVRG